MPPTPHLVQVAVRDLLQRLDLVDGDEVRVEVHELDGHLLELTLSQQVALDALQGLVRVVVRLGSVGQGSVRSEVWWESTREGGMPPQGARLQPAIDSSVDRGSPDGQQALGGLHDPPRDRSLIR